MSGPKNARPTFLPGQRLLGVVGARGPPRLSEGLDLEDGLRPEGCGRMRTRSEGLPRGAKRVAPSHPPRRFLAV